MMATLFLLIIYMAFISLGLPDSLLGVAWPLMQTEYHAPFEAAGLVSMFIAGSTIVSSFGSGFVHKHLSTGKITLISCIMTAISLLGFANSPSLIWLLFLAIPLGLGAGSVDAALNNYVASHYKAHHMSWLHCFWGIGATLGPIIMSWFIAHQHSWRNGYFSIALIQFALAALLFFTLPLWRHMEKLRRITSIENNSKKKDENFSVKSSKNDSIDCLEESFKKRTTDPLTTDLHGSEIHRSELSMCNSVQNNNPFLIKGVPLSLLSFLFYCAVETTMGLWGSSYLVAMKEMPAAVAAQWVSFYYGGITVGRFISGFITLKVSNKALIRIGQSTALSCVLLLLLPLPSSFSLLGFILVGSGFAPIFPCMMHETPIRFGKENSQKVIGYQMAFAYMGSTLLPPLLGLIAAHTTIGIFPLFVLAGIVILLGCSEKINILMKNRITAKIPPMSGEQ